MQYVRLQDLSQFYLEYVLLLFCGYRVSSFSSYCSRDLIRFSISNRLQQRMVCPMAAAHVHMSIQLSHYESPESGDRHI